LRLPAFELQEGLADDMEAGRSQLYLLGYPGPFLTVGTGHFWGMRYDEPLTEKGKWLLTGIPMNMGNSGGAAVDDRGRLVGIPSCTRGNISELRCVDEVIVRVEYALLHLQKRGVCGF
jgi:hypothetical protein